MPDRLKPSRMEVWLRDQMSRAPSQLEMDCRLAELAAYQARMGKFDDARKQISVLRQRNHGNPKIQLSVRLHFAEGLLSYFGNDGVTNADGVQRAYALSTAAGLTEMRALSAAWLAQWDYTRLDVDALDSHVREALQLAGPDDHASRARANLVVAQILHLAGHLDLAQPWYRRARDHAAAGFDDATIGALMHNMAWQRMLLFRQAVLTNSVDLSAGKYALTNAESTSQFGQIIGDTSWPTLTPILRAQIVSLSGNSAEALAIYTQHLSGESVPERWQANLLADKAWCHAVLQQPEAARDCAVRALANLTDDTQMDDRAATHSRLAQTFVQLKADESAGRHRLLAEKLWADFGATLARAALLLSKIDEGGKVRTQ